ncbi:hypothetical protein [Chryseobacterium viscerum]|uniref:Uncharacterized protein n=1 Tax=Chryseobacterium viscerum TaxID=1037377 RepID=A0A5N4BJ53_9FLAO|nr:hypothetical protein [Chryseobacterium viscerum]KAB1228468.1 hypothetical protein F8D52_22605 [Chryseobacterium viscerum]
MENTKTGVELIASERQKQIDKHGFTAKHSIEHPEWYDKEQLVYAAHSLLSLEVKPAMYIKEPDNWDKEWFIRILKKASADKNYRYRVVGAFLAAELDRIKLIERQNSPTSLDVIKSINEKLSVFLSDEDLTYEKLRDASESLLPNIQSDCAKILLYE